jgi:molybdopterin molybdotransferase
LFQVLVVLELEEALARILAVIPPPAAERVTLDEAQGRFALEPILAPIDLPTFTNSSMDGYALRAEDVAAADPKNPVDLWLVGRVAAGSEPIGRVEAGQCARVFTGSTLPAGADSVVMQEDTKPSVKEMAAISVLCTVQAGENVRYRGEDVGCGTRLVSAGCPLTVGRVSLLAATGIATVAVGRRPIVGVLATGSELRESGAMLAPGQIYESNRAGLAALVRLAGGVATGFPIVRDVLGETRQALADALDSCDILVTSGGVSVGEMDFIKAAFEQNGGELSFWKVAIKPGRPFVFGRWKEKLMFGLPGNPVSALVTFLLLVRPAILRWQGASEVGLPCSRGVLAEPLVNQGERRHFFRVRLDERGTVYSAGLQASHALGSLAAATGLIDVPPGASLEAGQTVNVLRWD